MKKNLVIVAVVAFFVVGGGITASQMNQDKKLEEQSAVTQKNDSDLVAESDSTNDDQVIDEETAASTHGSYITLADFEANTEKYSQSRNVYFFHAAWCPNCQAIHRELSNDDSKIPANVTIIKTDFDTETALRQKYGVTTQYTFVEVDKNGNELKQWSAPSIDDVYEEL